MNFKNILNYAMCFTIFMDDFIFLRYVLPFDFYYYYFIYLFSIFNYIVSKKSVKLLPAWFFIPVLFLLLSSVILTGYSGTLGLGVVKQIIGILFTGVAYYTFIVNNDYNLKHIFHIYLKCAFWVALYGVFEEVMHLAGFHIFKNFRQTSFGFYRVYSIMGEPYFLAVALIPAFFYHLSNVTKKRAGNFFKRWGELLVVGGCFTLTFSSAGFLGTVLMALLLMYNIGYFSVTNWRIVLLPVAIFIMVYGFLNIKSNWTEFDTKYNETFDALTNRSMLPNEMKNLNSSSFAIYSNYIVATHSFKENPVFGSGLGTHENTYDKIFGKYFDKKFTIQYGSFNKQDANSLFLRLMSETGLIGLLLFFIFLVRNLLSKKGIRDPAFRELIIMNQGIFIWICVRLMRTGNYFGNGFFLFFFIYYFSRKIVEYRLNEKKKEAETAMQDLKFELN